MVDNSAHAQDDVEHLRKKRPRLNLNSSEGPNKRHRNDKDALCVLGSVCVRVAQARLYF